MDQKWVTFTLGKELYAFELEYVQEMVRLPQCRPVPRMPQDHLGVAMLRNRIVPVVDLARTFNVSGSEAASSELIETLRGRKQDHINWINELEASVRESREFKLTLDPTKCKFGVWYASFKTDDPRLAGILRRMDTPHAAIHDLGHRVLECKDGDCQTKALRMIEERRHTTLARLLQQFDDAIEQVTDSARRILIVMRGRKQLLGAAVDSLSAVVAIPEKEIQSPDDMPGHQEFESLIGFWVNKQNGQTVRLLDPVSLYPQMTASGAEV